MRKLIIVGSIIQTRKNAPLTYSPTRTAFSDEERLRHTVYSISALRDRHPDTDIVLVDASDDPKDYRQIFAFLNVVYVWLQDISTETANIVRTHPNKSVCEVLLLNTYIKANKAKIKTYDYIIKGTGRYSLMNFDNSLFTPENTDKIFFKKPFEYEWNDAWRYSFVDKRSEQGDNKLRQYCTVVFGFGIEHLDKFIDMFDVIGDLLQNDAMKHYDIETLMYYFTRFFTDKIIETDWRVLGWDGVTNRLMYY
jgi:hypothetical protein